VHPLKNGGRNAGRFSSGEVTHAADKADAFLVINATQLTKSVE
jgi:hypothetical protein